MNDPIYYYYCVRLIYSIIILQGVYNIVKVEKKNYPDQFHEMLKTPRTQLCGTFSVTQKLQSPSPSSAISRSPHHFHCCLYQGSTIELSSLARVPRYLLRSAPRVRKRPYKVFRERCVLFLGRKVSSREECRGRRRRRDEESL